MFHTQIAKALGGKMTPSMVATETGAAELPSCFDVSDLALASVSAAACEVADLLGASTVTVDRKHTLMWFGMTLRPIGWDLPDLWDSIAGDYAAKDGWIKLHTNAPHHRKSALAVLGCKGTREAVAEAVSDWKKSELEAAVIGADGCAAAMHSLGEWAEHPQGRSVSTEPLIAWRDTGATGQGVSLAGLRVLDLTRVLAGPVATRFLAGYGANVLRIDPPDWNEPGVEPEVTLGKRCAGLDLGKTSDRRVFETLLQQADVLVHGYRPGALEGLGYGESHLRELSPGLIDVSLCAYGHSGPWAGRRGFDSLVQMSSGIAAEGMRQFGKYLPVPLPVQALDHATGYLMAATVLRALRIRQETGRIMTAQLSLARTAALLTSAGVSQHANVMPTQTTSDYSTEIENTGWGKARRISFPVNVARHPVKWGYPSGPLRQVQPKW
jgi:crotonobetainyl-CoA:carnitine CoA-transferase CaiB-like acyl-CoA transferase